MADIDEGWTRWLLEHFGFVYSSLRNADIQAGSLRNRFDSIIIADERPEAIENGHTPGTHAGGIHRGPRCQRRRSPQGFRPRRRHAGLSQPCLKVRHREVRDEGQDVVEDVPAQDFYSPGSLLNASLDLRDPLTRGLPRDITIWSESSPVWTTEEGSVARYPREGACVRLAARGKTHRGQDRVDSRPLRKRKPRVVRNAPAVSRAELPDLQALF